MRQSILRDGAAPGGPLDALGAVEAGLRRHLTIATLVSGIAIAVAIIALVVALLR